MTRIVEEAASQGEGGQDFERRLEEPEEFWCTYCGWPVDNSSGESGEDDAREPVPYAHGGFVHTRCMPDRAENLARGHVGPRTCVTCRSAWPEETDLPTRRSWLEGYPWTGMTEGGGR